MKVFCNGFPKAGNHALWKAVELLGQPAGVNHRPFKEGIPDDTTHHIFIVRDPRNIIVSWLRFQQQAVTPGTFLARFRRFDSASLSEEMARYEEWTKWEYARSETTWQFIAAKTYVVRYEDLIADDKAMRDLAVFLNVPYIKGAWEELPGLTKTWNKVRSDYYDIWTPEVIKAWYTEGGDHLLQRWGY